MMSVILSRTEADLLHARPDYGPYHRHDALSVIGDALCNQIDNHGLAEQTLPETARAALAFVGFYEAAMGGFSTHTAFGRDTMGDLDRIDGLARAIRWHSLSTQLEATRQAIAGFSQTELQDFVLRVSAPPERFAEMTLALLEAFGPIIEADRPDYRFRRAAAAFALREITFEVRPDDRAFPILASTRERAKAQGSTRTLHTRLSQFRAALLALLEKWRIT